MEWLNYHHLLYFWSVAKHGTVAKACEELHLAQPTISAQIRALEESLGEKLFIRTGRQLILTEMGRIAFRYAEDIFSIGRDLMNTMKGRGSGRPLRLTVGIVDVVPKLLAARLLESTSRQSPSTRLICWEDKLDQLLADLAIHGLDWSSPIHRPRQPSRCRPITISWENPALPSSGRPKWRCDTVATFLDP